MPANTNIKPISDAKKHENKTKVTGLGAEIYNIFGIINGLVRSGGLLAIFKPKTSLVTRTLSNT